MVWTEEKIRALADALFTWFTEDLRVNEEGKMQVTRFFLKDFAIVHGVPFEYFAKFARRSEYFREMYARCKDVQESKLVKYGMAGHSTGMVMLLLSKYHGYGPSAQRVAQEEEEANRVPPPKQVFLIGGKKIEF